jgi:hypothetical protein
MLALSSVGDITDLADAVNKGGTIVVLVAGILALAWVARWLLAQLLAAKEAQINNMLEERNAWRQIALGVTHTAERAATIAERQVGLPS